MILYKVIVSLMDKEKENSSIYVVLSWVTKFSNLRIKDIEGISMNRLHKKHVYI